MLFHVRHQTLYHYSTPVALGPQIFRLLPRPDGVAARWRRLDVTPQPARLDDLTDAFGNLIARAEFFGSCAEFGCVSEFSVETFLPAPAPPQHPLPWPIAPEFFAFSSGDIAPSVRAFAEDLARRNFYDALAFLADLTRSLHERTDRQIRIEGYAQTPEETLASAHGACRDLTLLFIACARSQGFAARFVSGYQAASQTADGSRHLHAWAEVFLPGAGWRGYDPTHGVIVTDGHVALCAAPDQLGTMPIEGSYSFSGTILNSTLDYRVDIDATP